MAGILFFGIFSFLQIAKQTNRQTKNRKCRARKRFLAAWFRHQNICQPTEIFLATILWLKYKLYPYLYKTNETKLHKFLKPKHAYMYLCFVIVYLRLKKTDSNWNSANESLQNCVSVIHRDSCNYCFEKIETKLTE